MRKILCLFFITALILINLHAQFDKKSMDSIRQLSVVDHKDMLDQLHIDSIRSGANGSDPKAPNAANYDEAKANPYPVLPDPLTLKNGKKVTSAKIWWQQRRPEIVEDFDREVYGRMPAKLPKVNWEVTSTTNEMLGNVPVITKKLVGHVDNSSYTSIAVNIQLTLTTPANAKGPVPVMMEFGFVFPPALNFLRLPPGLLLRDRLGSNNSSTEAGATQYLFQPVTRQTMAQVLHKAL